MAKTNITKSNSLEPNLLEDIKQLIEQARHHAYSAINSAMIRCYWCIGQRIVEEEQKGEDRAQYGKKILKRLSEQLTIVYGSGFSERYLAYFRKFYLTMPNFEILQTRLQNLSWSHILTSLRVEDEVARRWYLENTSLQGWSVNQLSRNIATQYYERHYVQPSLNASIQKPEKLEILKTPIMAEFLGFKLQESYSESELESSILKHLQEFLLELGRGFAFVARQMHIRTNSDDYFIDLVFYNIVLKCYVLIDLKIGKVTHQDVGQMDMYVRMYDELKRTESDNPTIGILLCAETDEDIARYSILNGSEQIFATKYKLNLPTEEELKREIEKQKEIFYLQHPEYKREP